MGFPELVQNVRPPLHEFGVILLIANQFELSALTQRSSSLDPAKLEYLNKHHLMQTWSTPQGLHYLAERAHDGIKVAFPTRCAIGLLSPSLSRADEIRMIDSQYTTIDYIKSVILTLEVCRPLVNIINKALMGGST